MERKITKTISIYRKSDGRFIFNSPTYDNLDISKCELMVLLGAIFEVNITNKKYSSWKIDITKIYPKN